MPHLLPPRISENELYERVKKNLRYLRKEVFYQAGFATLEIALVVDSSSTKLKRIEDDLKGTIDSFIVLLNFYGRAGIDLNSFFSEDLRERHQVGGGTGTDGAYVLGDPIAESSAATFYKNIAYLRRGFLKGNGISTNRIAEITGVEAEKILRIEKGGKGKIDTAISLIYYYIRKGFHVSTLITSDLSEH